MTFLDTDTLNRAPIAATDAVGLFEIADANLLARASQLRDQGHGRLIKASESAIELLRRCLTPECGDDMAVRTRDVEPRRPSSTAFV